MSWVRLALDTSGQHVPESPKLQQCNHIRGAALHLSRTRRPQTTSKQATHPDSQPKLSPHPRLHGLEERCPKSNEFWSLHVQRAAKHSGARGNIEHSKTTTSTKSCLKSTCSEAIQFSPLPMIHDLQPSARDKGALCVNRSSLWPWKEVSQWFYPSTQQIPAGW